eukprot:COSAG04_NODE_17469_length_468_cov_1.390244_1_plen_43_part_01
MQRRDHGYEDGLFTDRVLRTLAENEGEQTAAPYPEMGAAEMSA